MLSNALNYTLIINIQYYYSASGILDTILHPPST